MLGYIISIIILSILCYQDFKQHEISFWLLIILFAVFLITACQIENSIKTVFRNFAINAGFVLVQFSLVKLYFSVRKKQNEPLLDKYIGQGDLLFFLVCCLAFSVSWFIPFYIGSLVIALIAAVARNGLQKIKTVEIPLAGIMSCVMVLFIAIKLTHKSISFYDDSYLFQLMNIPSE